MSIVYLYVDILCIYKRYTFKQTLLAFDLNNLLIIPSGVLHKVFFQIKFHVDKIGQMRFLHAKHAMNNSKLI